MKTTLLAICMTLLIIGCKKDKSEPFLAQSDTTQQSVCPNSNYYLKFYGPNCDQSVLDRFLGEWEITDSVVLQDGPSGSPPTTRKIIGTFTGTLSKANFTNRNGINYYLTNLWGTNDTLFIYNNKDSINFYAALMPNYEGSVVMGREEDQLDIPFIKQPDGSLLHKRKIAISPSPGYATVNYFYIKLKHK